MIESLQFMLDGKRIRVLVARVLNIGAIDCCILLPRRWKWVDVRKVSLSKVNMINLVPRDEVAPITGEDRSRFISGHPKWGQHDLIVDDLGFEIKGRQVSPRIGLVSVEDQKGVKRQDMDSAEVEVFIDGILESCRGFVILVHVKNDRFRVWQSV
jgi:hypothetical protein